MKPKKISILIVVVLIPIAYLIAFWVSEEISNWRYLRHAAEQEKIEISPDEVISIFKNAGYPISSEREWEQDEISGRFGDFKQFISLEIFPYSLTIIEYENWEIAYKSVELSNERDRKWRGAEGFSFQYGAVMILVEPSDKAFGKELLTILEDDGVDSVD